MKAKLLIKNFTLLAAILLTSCGGSSTSMDTTTDGDTSTISDSSTTGSEDVNENIRTVVLNVKIPEALKEGEKITIGSTLNSWTPSNLDWAATKIDDLNYSLTFPLDISNGTTHEIQYKWTKQLPNFTSSEQWSAVEKEADGKTEISNRTLTISEESEKVTTVNDVVAAFADPKAPVEHTVVGNLDLIEDFNMPQFTDRTRTIRVWTPSNYDKDNKDVKYPVIYMHDAQNLFDNATSFAGEWGIDETMEAFIEAQKQSAIIVGIDNSSNRMSEYTPDWSDKPDAEGGKYAQFIVETLKPYIDQNYNTLQDKEHTMVAGSSMGGLISFYTGLKYNNVFGMVGCFSSSFQINTMDARKAFIESLDFSGEMPRIYIDGGKKETLWSYVQPVANELYAAGYPAEKIYTLIDENGGHDEPSWRRRFPDAYEWLISGENGNYEIPNSKINVEISLSQEMETYISGLGVDGSLVLYTGSLSASPILEKGANGKYTASIDSVLGNTFSFNVLYHADSVIDIFALDDAGEPLEFNIDVDQENVDFIFTIAHFEIKEKLVLDVNLPANSKQYFEFLEAGEADLILYTGSLKNSYFPVKISDTQYQLTTFVNPGQTIKFQVLYYGSNIEIYETATDGSLRVGSVTAGESGVTNLTYSIEGWQVPVDLTVEITMPTLTELGVPEGHDILVGLYDTGAVWGGSWRNSPLEKIGDNLYSITKKVFSGEVAYTVGYCTTLDGSPQDQFFEKNESGQTMTHYTEETKIPYSEWDGTIKSVTHRYTASF